MTEIRDDLRISIGDFLRKEASPERRRAAYRGAQGYDRALYEQLCSELGFAGLTVPESLGGLGFGPVEMCVLIEALGGALIASPLVDAWVCGAALAPYEQEAPVAELLSALAEGPHVVALAGLTGTPMPLVSDSASAAPGSARVSGRAPAVVFGAQASSLVVACVDASGAELLALVSPTAEGVVVSADVPLDHTRPMATVTFASAPAVVVGDGEAVRRLRRLAWLALGVESAAAARGCLDMTVAYLLLREQFGRPIGSFQALKHRAADLVVVALEALASGRYVASVLAGERPAEVGMVGDDPDVLSALAKTVGTDALWTVAADCLQLHGGIGFTYDHDCHLFLKRGKAAQSLLGTNASLRSMIGERLGL